MNVEKFVKINEKRFPTNMTDVFLLFLSFFEIEFGVGNNLSKPLKLLIQNLYHHYTKQPLT